MRCVFCLNPVGPECVEAFSLFLNKIIFCVNTIQRSLFYLIIIIILIILLRLDTLRFRRVVCAQDSTESSAWGCSYIVSNGMCV